MNHLEIARKYSATHDAVAQFSSQNANSTDSREFQRLRKEHILATRDYITSLHAQNFNVPACLEETNKREIELYGLE